MEAEDVQLKGYRVIEVRPWENASGGKAIECASTPNCTAAFRFDGPAGQYEIATQYFDTNNGEARFRLYVNDQAIDDWVANDHLPSTNIGGDSATRHRTVGVKLGSQDEIRVEGFPDRDERAALDYLEIIPASPAGTPK